MSRAVLAFLLTFMVCSAIDFFLVGCVELAVNAFAGIVAVMFCLDRMGK